MHVKDIMTSKSLGYCRPETKLHDAAKAMKKKNCGALPVVDKDRRVVGILTDRDICLSLALDNSKPLIKTTVGQIMHSKVHTIHGKDDISMALRQMRLYQISRLPVVDSEGKLKGIVSIHDLLNNSVSIGRQGFGDLYSPEENLTKTIKAVISKYHDKKASHDPFSEPVITLSPIEDNDFADELYEGIDEFAEEQEYI